MRGASKLEILDMMGKPCPIPVVEAKKALAKPDVSHVLVKVDNAVAVQNLERLANSLGYSFAVTENAKDAYEVTIKGESASQVEQIVAGVACEVAQAVGPTVVISRNTMGSGSEELGKILIKGFIYALTELPVPPENVIFLNSGAYLTAEDANTIDDLQTLVQKGTQIFTCGTCANYYNLQEKLAVGSIADMYGITEKMANATRIINI